MRPRFSGVVGKRGMVRIGGRPLCGFLLSDIGGQILIGEPFTRQPLGYLGHLVNGRCGADIMTTGKLINIAVQMLRAHFVVSAFIASLQH